MVRPAAGLFGPCFGPEMATEQGGRARVSGGEPIAVSVCICTLDRPDLLTGTLQSLAAAHRPSAVTLQVVVVDNSPRQSARDAVLRFRNQLPIEYGHATTLGLSRARNHALGLATGDVLLWTDDDVIVDPEWIRCYVDSARRYPETPFFGGPILPRFVGDPPGWLVDGLSEVSDAYALRAPHADAAIVEGAELPFGANFCVRRSAMGETRFDEALGWTAGGGLAGEETKLLRELSERCGPGRWVAGASVEHLIPADRQSLWYLRKYYLKRGVGHRHDPEVTGAATLFGRPRFAYRTALAAGLRFLGLRLSASPSRWLGAWRDLWVVAGLLHGHP